MLSLHGAVVNGPACMHRSRRPLGALRTAGPACSSSSHTQSAPLLQQQPRVVRPSSAPSPRLPRPTPRQRCSHVVRSSTPLLPDPVPEGLRLEPAAQGQQEPVYDEATKTVRIPLQAASNARRTKLVMFTCNKCGGRSARLVNPLAMQKGLVFCQCQHCKVWHTIAANNPSLFEEIRYREATDDGSSSSSSMASGSGASSDTELQLPGRSAEDADPEVASRPSPR